MPSSWTEYYWWRSVWPAAALWCSGQHLPGTINRLWLANCRGCSPVRLQHPSSSRPWMLAGGFHRSNYTPAHPLLCAHLTEMCASSVCCQIWNGRSSMWDQLRVKNTIKFWTRFWSARYLREDTCLCSRWVFWKGGVVVFCSRWRWKQILLKLVSFWIWNDKDFN